MAKGISTATAWSALISLSVNTSIGLLPKIGEDRIVITESGILAPADVARMRSHQVNAFLVGEAFMRADDPGEELARLFAD